MTNTDWVCEQAFMPHFIECFSDVEEDDRTGFSFSRNDHICDPMDFINVQIQYSLNPNWWQEIRLFSSIMGLVFVVVFFHTISKFLVTTISVYRMLHHKSFSWFRNRENFCDSPYLSCFKTLPMIRSKSQAFFRFMFVFVSSMIFFNEVVLITSSCSGSV